MTRRFVYVLAMGWQRTVVCAHSRAANDLRTAIAANLARASPQLDIAHAAGPADYAREVRAQLRGHVPPEAINDLCAIAQHQPIHRATWTVEIAPIIHDGAPDAAQVLTASARAERKAKGMAMLAAGKSQVEVAKALGISRQAVSLWGKP